MLGRYGRVLTNQQIAEAVRRPPPLRPGGGEQTRRASHLLDSHEATSR